MKDTPRNWPEVAGLALILAFITFLVWTATS